MIQFRKSWALLSTGGIALGVVQAFNLVNFADVLTQFLATFLSLLVALLFGGDPAALGGTTH